MSLNNLPITLKDKSTWVTWKFVENSRGGKPLKMPHYPKSGNWRKAGAHGSREDRKGLVPFDVALNALETSKKGYTGLGLAMLPENNLVAVDFDDCVIKKEIVPEVLALVEGTYWEFSPSKEGIRAFFEGTCLDRKSISQREKDRHNRKWGVEFFCAKGFVTVTGNMPEVFEVTGVPAIAKYQGGIAAFYEETFGRSDMSRDNANQAAVGMTDEEIIRMLDELWSPDCDYEQWLNIGMAIHHETDGDGFELWNEWSSKGSEYPGEEDCRYKWESFGRSSKSSVKTIRWMLHEKPIDFRLENSVVQFEDLGPMLKENAQGQEVETQPFPALSMTKNGEVENTSSNVNSILRRPDITNTEYAFDEFRSEVMVQGWGADNEWRNLKDTDYCRQQEALENLSFKSPSKEKVRDGIALVAEENAFDSAIHWLEQVVPEWDGVERVANFCTDYLKAQVDEDYARAVSLYVWTAHAGRVLEPGCKADMVPVLVGPQGCGKSASVMAIAPNEDFFATVGFEDDEDKNVRKTKGVLVVECAELRGLNGKNEQSIKDYLSRTVEKYVPKYVENAVLVPRRFIFWGSSNDKEFLSDPTGNRRWLPLYVAGGDAARVTEDRLQLWAEARELWKTHGVMFGEADKLAGPYRAQALIQDAWEPLLEEHLGTRDEDGLLPVERDGLTSAALLVEVLGLTRSAINRGVEMRLAKIMSALGYKSERVTQQGIRSRVWVNCTETAS